MIFLVQGGWIKIIKIKKYISFLLILILIAVYCFPVTAEENPSNTGVYTLHDGENRQAILINVIPTPSNESLQAFTYGWDIDIVEKPSGDRVSVYFPVTPAFNLDALGRTYIFPLQDEFDYSTTNLMGVLGEVVQGKSIEQLVKEQAPSESNKYSKIIGKEVGSNFIFNARIQKYTYNTATKQYSANGVAIKKGDICKLPEGMPGYFADALTTTDWKDFSDNFKRNVRDNYYGLIVPFEAEPVPPPTPQVNLTMPVNEATVIKGTTVTFKGFGTGVHHIAGFIDGQIYGTEQLNPNDDINIQMKYETTVKLDEVRDYTFQIKGRNTPLASDKGSILDVSEIHTVHVINPPADSGTIYVKCYDANNNLIANSEQQPIQGVKFNEAKIVYAPNLSGYKCSGSYQSFNNSNPTLSNKQSGTQQTVTLSSANQNAYVYFWYDEVKGPVAFIDGPTDAKAGESIKLSGSRSYCKQSGATIVDYTWSNGTKGVSLDLSFNSPGDYTVNLTVTDSNGLTDTATHKITVAPPIPEARFNLAGKIKENRKITINATVSSSPEKYPIDWTKATWKIEPILETGATWDWGVKASNGLLVKANSTLNQSVFTGQSILNFQARASGQYKVTLTVTNTYPATDTYQGIITVAEDLLPIADYEIQKENLREYDNPVDSNARKYAIVPINDKSYSPDGDYIFKRIWCFRFNEANNKNADGTPIFSDDTTRYKFEGSPSTLFLPAERFRLVVDNDNDTNVQVLSYEVGQIFMQVIVEEIIPDNETIAEFLLPSDKRVTSLQGW